MRRDIPLDSPASLVIEHVHTIIIRAIAPREGKPTFLTPKIPVPLDDLKAFERKCRDYREWPCLIAVGELKIIKNDGSSVSVHVQNQYLGSTRPHHLEAAVRAAITQ